MTSPVLHVRGSVLVGPHDVREELWVVGGKITYDAPTSGADVQSVDGWAMPGLVDAHCHVGLDADGAVDAATAEAQATTDRDAGALLLRDAGSPSDTRWIDGRDDLPRIVRAGRHLARTRRYIRNYAHEIEPEDLSMYVHREARAGDGWVKLVGDWIDRETGDLSPCWPREALVSAISAAHGEGARVTAHCFGEESLADFAAAGVDCIEHATGLVPDTIDSFAAHGIAIVPTLVNIDTFPSIAQGAQEKYPVYAAHLRDLHSRRYETIAAAHDAGVPIYLGTDAGGSLPHGLVAREAAELVRAGLSTVESLTAAGWGARRWLHRPGLEEGARADLVVYPADPRTNIRILAAPEHVIMGGSVVT